MQNGSIIKLDFGMVKVKANARFLSKLVNNTVSRVSKPSTNQKRKLYTKNKKKISLVDLNTHCNRKSVINTAQMHAHFCLLFEANGQIGNWETAPKSCIVLWFCD